MPRIAYFGPSGTFTEMALAQLEVQDVFDGAVERVSVSSPAMALEQVRTGAVDSAVVPIESSVEGSVPPTLDALAAGSRLQIMAETELDVSFTILARAGTALNDVRTLRAYPIAAAQVREWIDTNLPDVDVQFASSNAGAAEDVARGDADAAVSTALAGERLGLSVLQHDVADVAGARTRFVLVTLPGPPPPRTGSDRTALVLSPDNEPGALLAILSEFAIRGIDLTRIESRPTRTEMGTYRFYVDCVGHLDDPAVADALEALHSKTELRFLGSWPAAHQSGKIPPARQADWITKLRAGEADR